MERLNSFKINGLTTACFEEYPVWTWDDSEEYLCPIKMENNILPKDFGPLFIKASLKAKNGKMFNGYIIGLASYFGFGILIENQELIFNMNLEAMMDYELERLSFDKKDFFPVTYETDFQFANGKKVMGIFQLR